MPEKNTCHLSATAAKNYERQSGPAIFAPMAEAALNANSLPQQAHLFQAVAV